MPTLEFLLKFYCGAGFVCAIVFTAALKEAEKELSEGTDLPPLSLLQMLPIAIAIFLLWPYYLNEFLKESFKQGM